MAMEMIKIIEETDKMEELVIEMIGKTDMTMMI